MKKVNFLIQGCALALIMGATFAASAQTQSYHRMHHKIAITNYGLINPGQKAALHVPATAKPGALGVCWSRNLMVGKIKLMVPNYATIVMTPHSPVARFAIPANGQFSVKYETKRGFLHLGSNKNNGPVQLMCKF